MAAATAAVVAAPREAAAATAVTVAVDRPDAAHPTCVGPSMGSYLRDVLHLSSNSYLIEKGDKIHPALFRGRRLVGGAVLLRGDSLSVHVRDGRTLES